MNVNPIKIKGIIMLKMVSAIFLINRTCIEKSKRKDKQKNICFNDIFYYIV